MSDESTDINDADEPAAVGVKLGSTRTVLDPPRRARRTRAPLDTHLSGDLRGRHHGRGEGVVRRGGRGRVPGPGAVYAPVRAPGRRRERRGRRALLRGGRGRPRRARGQRGRLCGADDRQRGGRREPQVGDRGLFDRAGRDPELPGVAVRSDPRLRRRPRRDRRGVRLGEPRLDDDGGVRLPAWRAALAVLDRLGDGQRGRPPDRRRRRRRRAKGGSTSTERPPASTRRNTPTCTTSSRSRT